MGDLGEVPAAVNIVVGVSYGGMVCGLNLFEEPAAASFVFVMVFKVIPYGLPVA